MKSHDGDIELSVTLDTSGADSDIKKLKKKLRKEVSVDNGNIDITPNVDDSKVKNATKKVIDTVNSEIEKDIPVIKPEIEIRDDVLEDAKQKWLKVFEKEQAGGVVAPNSPEQVAVLNALDNLNKAEEKLFNDWKFDIVLSNKNMQDEVQIIDDVAEHTEELDAIFEQLGKTVEDSDKSNTLNNYQTALEKIEHKVSQLYSNLDKGYASQSFVDDRMEAIQEEVANLSEEEQEAFDVWQTGFMRSREAVKAFGDEQASVTENTSELVSKEKEATGEIQSLKDVINDIDLGEAFEGIVQDDLKEFQTVLNSIEKKASDLGDDLDMFEEGFKYSDIFKSTQKDAEFLEKELNKTLEKMHQMELLGEQDTEQYKKMSDKVEYLSSKLVSIVKSMDEMRESGDAYTEGIDIDEYQKTEKLFDILATKLGIIKKDMTDVKVGPETKKSVKSLSERFSELQIKIVKIIPSINKFASSILKMGAGNVMRSFKTIGNAFKRMTTQAKQFARQSTRMFRLRDILAYAIGIRSLFSLFTKLRGYITEGTRNLALWHDGNNRVNKSLSDLTSSLTYMKNAWGAAFSPILTIVTPVLDKLVQAIADAANALSYLFAKLTGQSTWYKAIRVQKDYAKSLNGTAGAASNAEQKLASYDKLVMVDTDKGGGASADVNSMFEEVPIEDAIESVDDFLDKLKEAWANADFTDIGRMIGLKLKDALDSIPWDYIKEFARKLAHSIATLLNGFFETEGLADSIGRTIAEAFNTIFSFVDEFVHTLHWDSIGKFIGDGLFSFVDTFDVETAGKAIGGTLRGLIEALYTALDTFAEQGGFELIGEKIATLILTGLSEMEDIRESGLTGWEELGKSIYIGLSGIFTAIKTAIEGVSDEDGWKRIGEGLGNVIKKIDFLQLGLELTDAVNSLVRALADAITGLAETAPLETAIASVIAAAVLAATAAGIEISGVTILLVAATVIIGFNVGEMISEALFPDGKFWVKEFSWSDFFNENSLQDVLDGMGLMITTWSDDIFFWWGVQLEERWGEIKAWGSELVFWWKDIIESLKEPVKTMIRFFAWIVTGGMSEQLNNLDHFFQDVINFFNTYGDDIRAWWDELWMDICAWSDDLTFWWNDIVEGVKSFVSDCQFWFDDMIDNITSGFIAMLNCIIDGINSLIGKLNTLDIDFTKMGLPSAITDMLGDKIDINLPKLSRISVPALAQGAVIPPNKQFLAMLGDQKSGVNIETPLDTMVEAFKIAMEDFGGNNNQPIVLQLDGRTIAQAVWDEDRKKYKQTRSFNY